LEVLRRAIGTKEQKLGIYGIRSQNGLKYENKMQRNKKVRAILAKISYISTTSLEIRINNGVAPAICWNCLRELEKRFRMENKSQRRLEWQSTQNP
jgi:hypothetical protein